LTSTAWATVSAIVVIYQPILVVGEATVIKTPKGFAPLAVPFECFPYHGHPPYAAIAQPNPLLSSAPESGRAGESNLAAMAGIRIETPFEENTIVLHLEELKPVEAFELTASTDDIVEATIECARRMAMEGKEHPKLRIRGKTSEEGKWTRWEKAFLNQDMRKPFKRPTTK
jgi:hypothetical protein